MVVIRSVTERILLAIVGLTLWLPIAIAQETTEETPTSSAVSTTDGDLEALLESRQQDSAKAFEEKYPEIKEAANAFTQRKFQEAEDILTAVKASHPELPPAGVMLGKWYAQIKDGLSARRAYERAARDDPNDPEPYVVFGENALRQQRVTDAALLFDRAVASCKAMSPASARYKLMSIRSYAGVAAVASAREQWDQAEAALRAALNVDGKNVPLLARLGRVLFMEGTQEPEGSQEQKKKFNNAYKLFQDVYTEAPDQAGRAEINMANLYHEAGMDKLAKQLIRLALERDGKTLQTQLAAAQWALTTGNRDILQQCATAAASIDDSAIQTQILVGFLARMNGDYPGAESAFEKARLASPTNALALNQLAIALSEQDDEEKRTKALQYADMCVRYYNDRNSVTGREALVTEGWVLYKLGRLREATQKVEIALSSGAVGPEAAYFCAVILNDRGRTEIAKTLLKKTLENSRRLFPNRDQAQALYDKLDAAE